jgi:hypothetical protein
MTSLLSDIILPMDSSKATRSSLLSYSTGKELNITMDRIKQCGSDRVGHGLESVECRLCRTLVSPLLATPPSPTAPNNEIQNNITITKMSGNDNVCT